MNNQNINNNYLIETGTKDYERLLLLNKIVNPYSIAFLKKYLKPGMKVLELGCGIGLMSQEIAKMIGCEGKVIGTDLNKDQLVIAEKIACDHLASNSNLQFKEASAYSLSDLNDTYDVIYARFLFIHLDNPDKVIEQIKSSLKPGGLLLVEELAGSNSISSNPQDSRLAYVKMVDELQEKIQHTDFSISDSFGILVEKKGFKCKNHTIIQPMLNTLDKRRIFSLGMKSVENSLIKSGYFSQKKYQEMIKEVENMENNQAIELNFYKIGQIAVWYVN